MVEMNGDINALCETIRHSLQTLHSAPASPTLKSAEETLRTITSSLSGSTALSLASALLTPIAPPREALFAFHLLETHVLPSFISLDAETRVTIRNHALTFMKLAPRGVGVRKCVAFVASLAVREWPQRWATFVDDLFTYANGIAPTRIIAVLRELSDDIYLRPEDIAPARRNDLRFALSKTLPQTLSFVKETTERCFVAGDVYGVEECLRCLQSVLQWADLTAVHEAQLLQACVVLLSADVKNVAVDVLDVVAARASQHEEEDLICFRSLFSHLVSFISKHCAKEIALSRVTDDSVAGDVGADEHEFFVRLVGVLCEAANKHFVACYLFTRRGEVATSEDDMRVVGGVCDLMIRCLASPSLEVGLAVLPLFGVVMNAYVKHAESSERCKGVVEYLVSGFVEAACATFIQFPRDAEAQRFLDLDYEEGGMLSANNTFRTRVMSSFVLAGKIIPRSVERLLRRFETLLRNIPPVEDSEKINVVKVRGNYIVADDSQYAWRFGSFPGGAFDVWVASIEASAFCLDAFANGVRESGDMGCIEGMTTFMRSCFAKVIAMNNASLHSVVPDVLRAFLTLYIVDPSALTTCIEHLCALIQNGGKGSRTRYRATHSLSVLFRRLSSPGSTKVNVGLFAEGLGTFCARVAESSDFFLVEQMYLTEATIASIAGVENERGIGMIEQLLKPSLDLSLSDAAKQVFESPQALCTFLTGGKEATSKFLGAFYILESASHQLTRRLVKSRSAIPEKSLLSRSIAPRSVEIVCRVIVCLHALYNRAKFSPCQPGLLFPTSREIVSVLNLENMEDTSRGTAGCSDFGGGSDADGSAAELRARDTLTSLGVEAPEDCMNGVRERLRDIRKGAYEIARACVLSGVTRSADHLRALIGALCTDVESMEGWHLVQLTSRVLTPLFSYAVCMADVRYLQVLEEGSMLRVLKLLKQGIEDAHRGRQIFSEARVLDFAREHARTCFARVTADLLAALYPRALKEKDGKKEEKIEQDIRYAPPALTCGQLGQMLIQLWIMVCKPVSGLDKGASRVAQTLVITAAESAPDGSYGLFEPLLKACLETCVSHLRRDEAADNAVGAMVAIMRRFPTESARSFEGVFDGMPELMREVCEGKSKRARAGVKKAILALLQRSGGVVEKVKVAALPERLVAVKKNAAQDDLLLGDHTIESLFREGDPL